MAGADPAAGGPVAAAERVSGFNIALIIVGITISVPAFIIGGQIMLALGLRGGMAALLLGGLLLATLGSVTMMTGMRSGLSSYALIDRAFGTLGAKGINLLIALTIIGWYSVTADMFGRALHSQLPATGAPPAWALTLLGSLAMIGTTLFGFRGIDRFSRLVVPLLLAVMLWGVWMVGRHASWEALWLAVRPANSAVPSIAAGASVVAGSLMVGVAIAPDVGRFARSMGHAAAAAGLSYGLASPFVFWLAGLPALLSGEADFLTNLLQLGRLPVLLVLTFAVWTTNVGNLYSASLAGAQLCPGFSRRTVTLLGGALGTALALSGISNQLIPLMMWLSILIPPIAGIYVIHYWRRGRHQMDVDRPAARISLSALCAWFIANLAGWLSMTGRIHVTSIVALDSLLVAILAYLLFSEVIALQRAPGDPVPVEERP